MKIMKKTSIIILSLMIIGLMPGTVMAEENGAGQPAVSKAEEILSGMSQDEKISQMIMPACRTWNGEAVTDLSDVLSAMISQCNW